MQKFLYRLLINFLSLFGVLCLTSVKQVAYSTTITLAVPWVVMVAVGAVGVSIYQHLTGQPQRP